MWNNCDGTRAAFLIHSFNLSIYDHKHTPKTRCFFSNGEIIEWQKYFIIYYFKRCCNYGHMITARELIPTAKILSFKHCRIYSLEKYSQPCFDMPQVKIFNTTQNRFTLEPVDSRRSYCEHLILQLVSEFQSCLFCFCLYLHPHSHFPRPLYSFITFSFLIPGRSPPFHVTISSLPPQPPVPSFLISLICLYWNQPVPPAWCQIVTHTVDLCFTSCCC